MVRHRETKKIVKRISGYGIVMLAAVFFSLPHGVHAASLYLSPSSENVTVGQTLVVTVGVSSPNQAMNAVSGDVSFPTGQLQVSSISETPSIISLWVRNPSFTNSAGAGDVHFEGIVLNPGFTGSAGVIIRIVFQVVDVGNAPVSFSDGSILANDGSGTNILSSLGAADFSVTPGTSVSNTDLTPPEPFTISEVSGQNSSDPEPLFTWHATDTLSGIKNYLVQIGSGPWIDAATLAVPSTTDEYELPPEAPGNNIPLSVEAFDNAGNMTIATTSFTVVAPSFSVTSSSAPLTIYCALRLSINDLEACGWFGEALGFFLAWGALLLLLVIILALVIFAIYTIVHRLRIWHLSSSRELLKMREELRIDLRRIEKEMDDDHKAITQKRVHQEIEHVEKDIKEDIKRLDDTEKLRD